jgi:hypothetical protein
MTSLAATSLALVVAALATGCAVDSQTAPSKESMSMPEYRTGSNISVRERRSTTSEEKARAAAPADASRPADPAVKPTN